MKTRKSIAKRVRVTSTGKIKRKRALHSHILTKKSRARKRHLRKSTLVAKSEMRRLRRMLPGIKT